VGEFTSKLQVYTTLSTIVFGVIVGYVYEFFGRKQTIFVFTLLLSILLGLFPYVNKNLTHLTLIRVGITTCIQSIL